MISVDQGKICYSASYNPLNTGRKLNAHKTFSRSLGRLLNVLCTFNLRPLFRRKEIKNYDDKNNICNVKLSVQYNRVTNHTAQSLLNVNLSIESFCNIKLYFPHFFSNHAVPATRGVL